jgi:hypothetical protein
MGTELHAISDRRYVTERGECIIAHAFGRENGVEPESLASLDPLDRNSELPTVPWDFGGDLNPIHKRLLPRFDRTLTLSAG